MAFRPAFVSDALLYKLRYIVGYGIVVVLLLVVVSVDVDTLPRGVNQGEMESVVSSMQLGLRPELDWVINAPYHAVQKLSVMTLGLSRTAIVLPSLLFGIVTLVVFALTMKQWFRSSVAILTTVIATTTTPFLSMIRGGTPDIMVSFWTVLLLFAAMRLLVKHDKALVWKIVIATASVGLLYTPFGIYPLLAFVVSGLLHPHVRSRLRKIRPGRWALLIAISLFIATPLILHLVIHPASIALLSGYPTFVYYSQHLLESLRHLYYLYGTIFTSGFMGTTITPVFNIVTIILALLGLFRVIRDHHTARSYVMLTWTLVTLTCLVLAPTVHTLVLMPTLLLLAIGIETLVLDWYKLFPRNPYARVAGLIPLSILFVTVASSNLTHYFYTHRYQPSALYSQALPALKRSLDIEGNRPVILVSDAQSKPFYEILHRRYPGLSVTTELPATISQPLIVLPSSGKVFTAKTPSRIITSPSLEHSAVLRVYRP